MKPKEIFGIAWAESMSETRGQSRFSYRDRPWVSDNGAELPEYESIPNIVKVHEWLLVCFLRRLNDDFSFSHENLC